MEKVPIKAVAHANPATPAASIAKVHNVPNAETAEKVISSMKERAFQYALRELISNNRIHFVFSVSQNARHAIAPTVWAVSILNF